MRYVSIPNRGRVKAVFVHHNPWLGDTPLTADTVFEQDDALMPTGVPDFSGTLIHRVQQRRQIGFDLIGTQR